MNMPPNFIVITSHCSQTNRFESAPPLEITIRSFLGAVKATYFHTDKV